MIQFQNYGILISVAIVLSLFVSKLLSREAIIKPSFFVTLFAFIIARLVYVCVNINFYFVEIAKPIAILNISDGGLSLFGAIIGILFALLLINRANKIKNMNRYIDSIAVSLWIFIAIIRYAESFIEVGLGRNVDFKGFLTIEDYYGFSLLAVYKLEMIFAIIAFIAFILIFNKHYKQNANYNRPYIFYYFISILSASQIVFESMRNDGHMLIGFVHVQQILYAILLVLSILFVHKQIKKINKIKANTILLSLFIFILVIIDFAMEFVIDGRLNLNLNIGIPVLARNYLIISVVSMLFIAISINKIKKLKASSIE